MPSFIQKRLATRFEEGMMELHSIRRLSAWSSLDILTVAGVFLVWAGLASAENVAPGEMKLARALEGRTAGKVANCLTMRNVQSSRVIPRTAIIFEVGNTLYVNRPSGAEMLSDSKTLVTRSYSSQLCKGEAVELLDLATRVSSAAVLLGEFVPYRKSERDHFSPPYGGYQGQGRWPSQ